MNELFQQLGISSWKPWITALLLPPVPLLVLMLVGARLMFNRRLLAWLLVLVAVVGQYLLATSAVSHGLVEWLLRPPPAITEAQLAELKRAPRTTIVVLGGGRRSYAPEYGMSTLQWISIERLRYGIWLSRETGLPLGFSGGIGNGAGGSSVTEAEVATRIAEREFGRPLKWSEGESRDTHENANKTVALLRGMGVERIVLVTHDFHMRRAVRNFERAAAGQKLEIVPAPLGMSPVSRLTVGDWLPSLQAYALSAIVMHEWLGWIAGA